MNDKRVNISKNNPSIVLIRVDVMNAEYAKIFVNLMLVFMDIVI